MMKIKGLVAIFLLWVLKSSAQCVLLNEVMINPNNACDGSCMPNTAEWIELFNTCTTPVDISCFVITDGDFSVTIPSGTTIPANGYFVIGSNNSGGGVNLNIATCGCTAGLTTEIGILSNTAEQLLLLNAAGLQQDAIFWGGGQFPLNITSTTLGPCAPLVISRPNNTGFATVPVGNDGCTVGRTCDASATWQVKCGGNISKGASNGMMGIPAFTASSTTVCPGDCISFTDNSQGNPISWFWIFSGAATGTSNVQNPSTICYNNSGTYSVTLQISNSCGTFTATQTGYITVGSGATPNITPNGPTNFCEGGTVVLSTNAVGTYQWQLNGTDIVGANSALLTVNESGVYTVAVSSGACAGLSNDITVNVFPAPVALVNALSSTTLCSGDSVLLQNADTAASYQWLLNGNPLAGQNNQEIAVGAAGTYVMQVASANGCTATSAPVDVVLLNVNQPAITTANGQLSFCQGQSLQLTASAGMDSYQWYLNNLPITGATTTTYTATQTGSYSVVNTAGNGCSASSAAVIVNLLPLPSALLAPAGPILICNAVPALLQGPAGAASYQWYNENGMITGAVTAAYSAAQSGNYYVNITNADGCTANSNTVVVSFNTGITVSIFNPNPTPCEGDLVFLSTMQNYAQSNWSNGADGIQIAVSESGKYSVLVVNSGGCTATDEVELEFAPKPRVEAGDEVYSDCVKGALLSGYGDGIPNWEPADGLSNSNTFEVNAFPENTRVYYLTVDNGTCKATDSVKVFALCSSVYVPSGFTPNNDGNNDSFKAVGMDVKDFSMVIYNRWGEKIFETKDIAFGWDGTYSGTPAPMGMYIWQIEANDKNGNSLLTDQQRRGTVCLVR
jgi:gliding motility-associated-like protein